MAMFQPLLVLPLGWCNWALDTGLFLMGGKSKVKANENALQRKFQTWKKRHRQGFIIFPEGTIIKNFERNLSQEYARKMEFPQLHHVLLPRVKAFEFAVRELSKQGVDELYDLTILYPQETNFASSPYSIGNIFCLIPRGFKVHFIVKRYSLREEKLTDEATFEHIRGWLYKLYVRKNKLMETWKQEGAKVLSEALRDFNAENGDIAGNIENPYACRQETKSVLMHAMQSAPYAFALAVLGTGFVLLLCYV